MSEQKKNKRTMAGDPIGQKNTEKSKDFKATWGKLIAYCKNYMPAMIVALILATIGTVLQIIGPDMLKEMTNEIMVGLPALVDGVAIAGAIDLGAVRNIAFLLVAFYAGSAILSFIQGYMMATVTQKISKNMRTGISKKLISFH